MAIQQQKSGSAKVKGVADIVFCFDISGSMQPILNGVRDNVKKFVENLKSGNTNNPLDWRAIAVGYRDADVDSVPFEGFSNSFTNDVDEFAAQIDSFEADGGGDEPESLLDALYKIATEVNWSREIGSAHRIVVVFTDATCKSEMNSSTLSGDRSASTVKDVYSSNRLKLYIYGIKFDLYESLCNDISKSIYSPMGETYEDVQASFTTIGFDKVLEQLGKTVSGASGEVLDAGTGGVTDI